MKYLILFFISLSTAFASPVDQELRKQIIFFKIDSKAPRALDSNRKLVELGKRLFIDPNLSGNKNISCMTCHNPMNGTSDGRALSQTHNAQSVLKRNSPALFNLANNSFMFWDGRVHYDNEKKIFVTPEENLNGDNPKYNYIAKVLDSALAAQTIFPIMSNEEMKGDKGENEIADAKNNEEGWNLIVKRLLQIPAYQNLFKDAFKIDDLNKVNIGHVGVALAHFISEQFDSTGSPFNRYLNGEVQALTEQEKEGMLTFIQKGCIACHQGGSLGLNTFFASVGVPQYGKAPFVEDIGRGASKGEEFRKYFFRTPSLLNVGLTAPYMHNGAFKTLRDVLNHYSDIQVSLDSFDLSQEDQSKFPVEVEVNQSPVFKRQIFNSIQAPFLRNGLHLTEPEKDDLEAFLSHGLTDPKFIPTGKM